MPNAPSYDRFFPRHSFGEVPLCVYSEFEPDGRGGGKAKIFSIDPKAYAYPEIMLFLVQKQYWEERLGEAKWRNIDFFKSAFISGFLAKGEFADPVSEMAFVASEMVSGATILSKDWGANGIRHVDFVERAVPIPEDEDGFQDYVRRWRERELRDQGYIEERIDPVIYHELFARVNGPIRYNFFLPEEIGGEPECYYRAGRVYLPVGFPVIEDLLAERFDFIEGEETWMPVWLDTIYPLESSLWMWIGKKDGRLKVSLALANRSGNISLQLVPYYFSLIL